MLVKIFILTLLPQYNGYKQRLVMGGKNVSDIAEFPHALYILFSCGQSGTWLCGGSVLTQHIFLTAAHCLNIHCDMSVEAVAGSEVIGCFSGRVYCDLRPWSVVDALDAAHSVTLYQEKSIIRMIHRYYRHQYFDEHGPSMRNDIALLAVKVPLPLGRNIKRVVVAKHFPTNSKMVTVAGWGRVSDNSTEVSKFLKFVWQFIKSNEECQERLSESLWPGQMCALNSDKDHPTVHDSGCALVTKTGQQVGIVSYRIPRKAELVVYTNVTHFYPWIRKQARLLFCEVSKIHIDINKDDYYGEDPNADDI